MRKKTTTKARSVGVGLPWELPSVFNLTHKPRGAFYLMIRYWVRVCSEGKARWASNKKEFIMLMLSQVDQLLWLKTRNNLDLRATSDYILIFVWLILILYYFCYLDLIVFTRVIFSIYFLMWNLSLSIWSRTQTKIQKKWILPFGKNKWNLK